LKKEKTALPKVKAILTTGLVIAWVVGHIDVLEMKVAEGALYLESVPVKGIPVLCPCYLRPRRSRDRGSSPALRCAIWASYGKDVNLPALLISCASESAEAIVRNIVAAGYADARVIGYATAFLIAVRIRLCGVF
jgi:hypothetical protein